MHCTSLLMQSSSCARKEIKAHVLTLDITSMSVRSQIDIFHPCVHTNTKNDDDKTSLVQQDVMLIMSVHIKRLSAGSCISSHERHVSYVRQLCASVAYSFSKHHPSFYKLRLIEWSSTFVLQHAYWLPFSDWKIIMDVSLEHYPMTQAAVKSRNFRPWPHFDCATRDDDSGTE